MDHVYYHFPSRDELAAKLLAAAVCIRCPKASIVWASHESYGFCSEFYLTDSISEELFPFLEETMRQLLQEQEIRVFEMIPSNAIEFLKFHHQKERARQLKEWPEALVQTIQIGGYVDYLGLEISLKEAKEALKAFKLVGMSQTVETGRGGDSKTLVRIKGVTGADGQELKSFVKKVKRAAGSYHTKAEHLMKVSSGEWGEKVLWLPQGLAIKQKIVELIKELFLQQGFQEIQAHGHVAEELQEALNSFKSYFYLSREEGLISEEEQNLGLYGLEEVDRVRGVIASDPLEIQKTCELCFGIIKKVLSELDLSYQISLEHGLSTSLKDLERHFGFCFEGCERLKLPVKGKFERLQIMVKDSFDRSWEVASIEIDEKKNPCYVIISFFSLERLIALLLDTAGEAFTLRGIEGNI